MAEDTRLPPVYLNREIAQKDHPRLALVTCGSTVPLKGMRTGVLFASRGFVDSNGRRPDRAGGSGVVRNQRGCSASLRSVKGNRADWY